MAIATTEIPTIADLLAELGDIPPHRVLLRPYPGAATKRDVIAIHARHKRLCELQVSPGSMRPWPDIRRSRLRSGAGVAARLDQARPVSPQHET